MPHFIAAKKVGQFIDLPCWQPDQVRPTGSQSLSTRGGVCRSQEGEAVPVQKSMEVRELCVEVKHVLKCSSGAAPRGTEKTFPARRNPRKCQAEEEA